MPKKIDLRKISQNSLTVSLDKQIRKNAAQPAWTNEFSASGKEGKVPRADNNDWTAAFPASSKEGKIVN